MIPLGVLLVDNLELRLGSIEEELNGQHRRHH